MLLHTENALLDLVKEECNKKSYTLLYATLAGSHAYGNSTPESDVDIRFVFAAPIEKYFGFAAKSKEHDSLAIDGNDVFGYQVSSWVQLLLSNNPTVLEMLFMEDASILYKHPSIQPLFDYKQNVLSKKCFDSYLKYAEGQIYKAKSCTKEIVEKLDQYEDLLKYNQINLQNLAVKQVVRTKAVAYPETWKHGVLADSIGCLIDDYKTFKQNKFPYSDLGQKRREYLRKFGADMKNLSHALRLSRTCKDIFEKKELKVRRDDSQFFLEIKHGKYSLEFLEEMFLVIKKETEKLREVSDLPEEPDRKELEKLNVKILKDLFYGK